MIRVISKRCPQNHVCPMVKKCPEQAVNQEGLNAPGVDDRKCIGCMTCVKRCPNQAFEKVDGRE